MVSLFSLFRLDSETMVEDKGKLDYPPYDYDIGLNVDLDSLIISHKATDISYMISSNEQMYSPGEISFDYRPWESRKS